MLVLKVNLSRDLQGIALCEAGLSQSGPRAKLIAHPWYCCNLSGGVALIVWFTTNGMCVKNNTIVYVARASSSKRDCGAWSLLLLAATVRSFGHMPLRISDRNKMVLWPGCGGRTEFSLHAKKVRSVWFVVKRRGCCCNLSSGVVLIVWFTMNGMCVKNNTIVYVAWASNRKRDCGAWSLLLLAATVWSFAHMLLGISDRNSIIYSHLQHA